MKLQTIQFMVIYLFREKIVEDEESQKVKAAVWSNSGLCQLKLKNWLEVRRAVSVDCVQMI